LKGILLSKSNQNNQIKSTMAQYFEMENCVSCGMELYADEPIREGDGKTVDCAHIRVRNPINNTEMRQCWVCHELARETYMCDAYKKVFKEAGPLSKIYEENKEAYRQHVVHLVWLENKREDRKRLQNDERKLSLKQLLFDTYAVKQKNLSVYQALLQLLMDVVEIDMEGACKHIRLYLSGDLHIQFD